MPIFTIGHGSRPSKELVACLREVQVEMLVDVRRFPASRRNPQFGQEALAETVAQARIAYRHEVELGGRVARGHLVVHLLRPAERESHRPSAEADVRGEKLFLCGEFVA